MSFEAKYNGTCAECGGDIRKGEEITYNQPFGHDGEVQHVRCPDAANVDGKPGPLCPNCFMELPKTGVCECRD